jgi:hypothetical protein
MSHTQNKPPEHRCRVKFLRDSVADHRDFLKDDVADIPASEAKMLAQRANASGVWYGRGPSVLILSDKV